jgi:hypothetical protein
MQKILMLTLILCCVVSANAQLNKEKFSAGLEGGPDWCVWDNYNYLGPSYLKAFSAGFTGEYSFTKKNSFKTGLIYEIKGHFDQANGTDSMGRSVPGSYASIKDELDYLVLPAYAKLYLGSRVKFFANAGPYFGFLLNAQYSSLYHDSNGDHKSTMSETGFNFLDVGIGLGLGISVPFKDRFSIELEGRSTLGLITVHAYNPQVIQGPITNSNISILLGLKYRLSFNENPHP